LDDPPNTKALINLNPETCVKTVSYIFHFSILLMAYSKAPLNKKLAGNFRAGLFFDFVSSPGVRSKRDLKVLSVIF